MSKLIRNTSDEENRRFWEGVEKGAAEIEAAPSWMKAGLRLNARHFHTYAAQGVDSPASEKAEPADE